MRTARKYRSTGRFVLVASLAVASLPIGPVAAGEAAVGQWCERARYLMGTLCEARAFGDPASTDPALDAALERIAELEDAMTTYREDGGLARLNNAFAVASPAEAVAISEDLFVALDAAIGWARSTEGSFDPTIGSVLAAWGMRDAGRRPSEEELAAALRRTSWRLLELDRSRRTARALERGLALDLGGFGKGFALDAAAEVLRARGVGSALLNFGGQVLAIGAPPGEPGWIVEIADPADRTSPIAALTVRDASVATSGNAERSFVIDGKRYGHLLDPRTGRPVERRGSGSVVARNGAAADALATALVVAGPGRAARLFPRDAEYLYLERADGPGGALVGHAGPGIRQRLRHSVRIDWISTGAESGSRERGRR